MRSCKTKGNNSPYKVLVILRRMESGSMTKCKSWWQVLLQVFCIYRIIFNIIV